MNLSAWKRESMVAIMKVMKNSRSGMTIVETLVALSLLAIGLVATVQVLGICAIHRRASEQLLAAQLEAGNIQEHISSLPYDQITADSLGKIALSSPTQSALPGGELKISLHESDGANPAGSDAPSADFPSKRIRVEVQWPAEESSPHSVGLTSWKYAPAQESKP
jgi:type II secretory pathway pseudopilin PulG